MKGLIGCLGEEEDLRQTSSGPMFRPVGPIDNDRERNWPEGLSMDEHLSGYSWDLGT